MPEYIDRRSFLRLAGVAGGAALLTGVPGGRGAAASLSSVTGSPSAAAVGSPAQRILVVIEMQGGNDGPSMSPPADPGALWSLRANSAHPEESLLRPGGDVVLHPALERLQHRPLAVVDGVGSPGQELSHFEMMRRWWFGDVDGTKSPTTGFLGRLCDAVDVGAPVTGLSLAGGSSPAMLAARAGTLGLPAAWWLWWLTSPDESWEGVYRDSLIEMSAVDNSDSGTLANARRGLATGLDLRGLADAVGEGADNAVAGGYPESTLGQSLHLAARVLEADIGVRVVHLPAEGDYDTHQNHRDRHDTLMAELDSTVDAFLTDIDGLGLTDRVLVATTSEFGRRPEENGNAGLDHGIASTMLVTGGPVNSGRYGEPVSYDRLDDDGNVSTTVPFDRYLATLAAWLDVPADEVVGAPVEMISGIWPN